MDDHLSIGGIAEEFYHRIYEHYAQREAWKVERREQYFKSIKKRVYSGRNEARKIQWVFESHVAERIFREMMAESGVQLAVNERLDLEHGVHKKGSALQRITMESENTYEAKVFIDASYEGDLMALAGVSYTTGRKARGTYDEDLAGIRVNSVYGNPYQSIDPYVVKGDPSSGLLPFIDPYLIGAPGQSDRRTQAFCYRLTLTDNPKNRLPIRKPSGYNPLWYEYLTRRLELDPELPLRRIITLTPMPNRKTDTNGIDLIDSNYGYAAGSYNRRKEIREQHRTFALGMLWFLTYDPRVPGHTHREMARWGMAKDEFRDNDNFPHRIYVREARRMVSDYVMTQHNALTRTRIAPYSVGVATYALDSHRVARFVGADNTVHEEGHFYQSSPSYPISYESI